MFGKNSWTEKLKDKLSTYIDERFTAYREQLANDLARGVSTLAALLVMWSTFLLLLFFTALVFSFLLAELCRPWVGSWAYVLGFGFVLCSLSLLIYFIRGALPSIEKRVFEDIKKALLSEPAPPVASSTTISEGIAVADDVAEELPSTDTELLQEEEELPTDDSATKSKDPFRN